MATDGRSMTAHTWRGAIRKILSVVGARPNFMAIRIHRACRETVSGPAALPRAFRSTPETPQFRIVIPRLCRS